MKLTNDDKAKLYVATLPAVVALKLTTAPPNSKGEAKKVSIDFAAAVWTKRYVETLAKVLEDSDEPTSSGGSGFPS